MKFELQGKNEIFFNYINIVGKEAFDLEKQVEYLSFEFKDYPDMLTDLLDSCIKNPLQYFCCLEIMKNSRSLLKIFENMEYKNKEIFRIEFAPSSLSEMYENICQRMMEDQLIISKIQKKSLNKLDSDSEKE